MRQVNGLGPNGYFGLYGQIINGNRKEFEMARKATLAGTEKRIEAVRTQVANLERDLYILGEDIGEFTVFKPTKEFFEQLPALQGILIEK